MKNNSKRGRKEAKKGGKVIKREGEQEISENEKITL